MRLLYIRKHGNAIVNYRRFDTQRGERLNSPALRGFIAERPVE